MWQWVIENFPAIAIALGTLATTLAGALWGKYSQRKNYALKEQAADLKEKNQYFKQMDDLTKAQKEMRKELLDQIKGLRDELNLERQRSLKLEADVAVLQKKNDSLLSENEGLRKRISELESKLVKYEQHG